MEENNKGRSFNTSKIWIWALLAQQSSHKANNKINSPNYNLGIQLKVKNKMSTNICASSPPICLKRDKVKISNQQFEHIQVTKSTNQSSKYSNNHTKNQQSIKKTKSYWWSSIVIFRGILINNNIIIFIFRVRHILRSWLIKRSYIIFITRNSRLRSRSSGKVNKLRQSEGSPLTIFFEKDMVMISCISFSSWINSLRMWLLTVPKIGATSIISSSKHISVSSIREIENNTNFH